jgi:hypothetical protein
MNNVAHTNQKHKIWHGLKIHMGSREIQWPAVITIFTVARSEGRGNPRKPMANRERWGLSAAVGPTSPGFTLVLDSKASI